MTAGYGGNEEEHRPQDGPARHWVGACLHVPFWLSRHGAGVLDHVFCVLHIPPSSTPSVFRLPNPIVPSPSGRGFYLRVRGRRRRCGTVAISASMEVKWAEKLRR